MSIVPTSEGAGPLRVDTAYVRDEAILTIEGEIDMLSVCELDRALRPVESCEYTMVVLDLARLSFIDSSGLNRLVIAMRRKKADGGELVLRAPTPQTLRVLELVGLTRVFRIV